MNNEITEYIIRDEETFDYLIKDNWIESAVLERIEEDIINNKINLPFVSKFLQNLFPFIQKGIKQELIDKAIEQGNCVHEMIKNSIEARNQVKLTLVKNDCKNPNHINLAIRLITELNGFIYKYKITKMYAERTFINLEEIKFIGTPDILMTNGSDWFLMDIKTSRVNYVEKNAVQLQLYKMMLENAGMKITKMFVLNPREDRVLTEVETMNKKEWFNIKKSIS